MSNPRNVAEGLLLRLKQLGVDYFFANPGTEFVSIIRGFHELPPARVPVPVLAPHEFQAVSMAYGCYLASGRPQAVMTHATVGTANALMGLIGAARMHIPLLYIAGMTSSSERTRLGHRDKLIHWSQDARDPLGMCREYVKWEIRVDDPAAIFDVIDRAYAIAMSPPCGPVAIGITRDMLVTSLDVTLPPAITMRAAAGSAPNPEEMSQVIAWLRSAQRPVVITNRIGRDATSVKWLVQAAEHHGLGVVTPEDFYVSFPPDNPHHLGCGRDAVLAQADFIMVLDTDAPWYPLESGPSPQARIVHVGADPLFEAIPLRSHPGELFLRCDPGLFLSALCDVDAAPGAMRSRSAWLRSRQVTPLSRVVKASLSNEGVAAVISGMLDEQTVLINELGLRAEWLPQRRLGAYFRSGAASPLGWGVGCVLGIGMMEQDKTMLVVIGDGVFYLSPLLGVLAVSVERKVALIVVVLNNGGMRSIVNTVNEFYPMNASPLPLTVLPQTHLHLEKCAEFVSGWGCRVTSEAELRHALEQAKIFTQERRRPVIINAVISDA